MTSGYILILAILVLGGVIAASGDRIGTRVGKARLTLFSLRPRQTATLVTILTGCLIAASTLGILFAASEQLRTGVFDLNRIQRKLSSTREDLTEAIEQKNEIESELVKVRSEQSDAQKRLQSIETYLKIAIAKQTATAAQLKNTQQQFQVVLQQKTKLGNEIEQLQTDRQELIKQRELVKQQVGQLNVEVSQLGDQIAQLRAQETQLNAQVAQLKGQINLRDREISRRNSTIAERDKFIVQLQEQEKRLNAQKNQLRKEIVEREARREQLENQLQGKETLLTERQSQLKELEKKLAQRDGDLKEREAQIQILDRQRQQLEAQLKERDRQLKQLEAQLKLREQRLSFLEQEVKSLETDYQSLRQGNVAVLRNQVLAAGVLQIVEPSAAPKAIDQLLSQANRQTIKVTRLDGKTANQRVVQITQADVERVLDEIKDGREYFVRIISAGNYLVGETEVQVFADAVVNQDIFSKGEVLAQTSADPTTMSQQEVRNRINQLLASAQLASSRAGMIGDTMQIGNGNITNLLNFLQKLREYNQPVDIQAVVAEDIKTSGPLKLKLLATSNGKVLFST
ncbi:MAG: DUF3084 domain-containing protein [Cyanosarcina radialis HA8281-LM2]|jgi:uncharacterized protein (DUF3084 family)|nr:DUF3084 domain-containing protein [Cyanosarcina radialis HA8281-LM2]